MPKYKDQPNDDVVLLKARVKEAPKAGIELLKADEEEVPNVVVEGNGEEDRVAPKHTS